MRSREDAAYQREAGLDYVRAFMAAVASHVDGFYLIAPHTQPEVLVDLVTFAKRI